MSVNKYHSHVLILPEDRANSQIANGFVGHHQVISQNIQILPPAGGWQSALERFLKIYVRHLRKYEKGHVVLLIDFDGQLETRRKQIHGQIPEDLKERTFVLGARETPEALRQATERKFEDLGRALADECFRDVVIQWNHEHLMHNDDDRVRLVQTVRPIVFAN